MYVIYILKMTDIWQSWNLEPRLSLYLLIWILCIVWVHHFNGCSFQEKAFFHIPTGFFIKTLSFDDTEWNKNHKYNVEDQEGHITTVWEAGDDDNRRKLITTCWAKNKHDLNFNTV